MTTQDLTRAHHSSDREWIPVPLVPRGEAWILVLHADRDLHKVVFRFRFGPGTALPPHTHECHAIAYTVSGSWEYEGIVLRVGSIAYEPVASTHAATSQTGAELVVVLDSASDAFLINHLDDGSDVAFDMDFFETLTRVDAETARQLALAMAAQAAEHRGQAS